MPWITAPAAAQQKRGLQRICARARVRRKHSRSSATPGNNRNTKSLFSINILQISSAPREFRHHSSARAGRAKRSDNNGLPFHWIELLAQADDPGRDRFNLPEVHEQYMILLMMNDLVKCDVRVTALLQ